LLYAKLVTKFKIEPATIIWTEILLYTRYILVRRSLMFNDNSVDFVAVIKRTQ